MQIVETQANEENILINLTTYAQHLENAQQIQKRAANTETSCKFCTANTETRCKYRNVQQIQKRAANTETRYEYRNALQIQKRSKYRKQQQKWFQMTLKVLNTAWSGPCIISSCLCCGFLTSATALLCACRTLQSKKVEFYQSFSWFLRSLHNNYTSIIRAEISRHIAYSRPSIVVLMR